MDNYQAIYDAIRSRFHMPDLEPMVRQCFDISWQVEAIKLEFLSAAYEQQRPSVLFRPALYPDGNMWCALYGEDLQNGCAGFGETPQKAMWDFDKNWNAQTLTIKEPTP
jgi:hypothetical protein